MKSKLNNIIQTSKKGAMLYCAFLLVWHTVTPIQVMAAPLPDAGNDAVNALVGTLSDDQPAAAPQTVQDVLVDVCKNHQPAQYDEACAKVLFGILWQESRNNPDAVGDHGMSFGYFQINRYYNPGVTVACAKDLHCSADWTLTHLEKHGYPKYVNYAIQCHNGCGFNNGYLGHVKYKMTLWDAPLAMK